ncbi:MAG TPA: hypothetical protein VH062_03905 [Polyangiaceae bacterium]|nr:hypothetical protein [Polyangiaceae bacterium]
MTSSTETRAEPGRDAVQSALLVLLTLPWVIHALVVGLSATGARPLGSGVGALAIVATALVASGVARTFGRSAVTVSGASSPVVVRRLSAVLSVAALAALAGATLVALAFPVVAYDAVAYRLPTVASWLDAGRVAWLVTDDPVRNGYPLGQEAVSAVLAAATGSMRFAALVSVLHVGAGALSIWLFAERIGVRRELGRASAALFALVPMVILNAPSGYVDAAFAGAAVSCVLLGALAFGSDRDDRVLAGAAGMAAAHALSLKGTGVALVLALGVGVVGVLVTARLRKTPVAVDGLGARLALFAVFAAPGAFWLLRNVAHTGNPLWPVDVVVAGHRVFTGVASMESVLDVVHNTPTALARLSEPGRLLHTWFEWRGPAIDFDDRTAGLGLLWPLAAVPAVVYTVARFRRLELGRPGVAALAIALTATTVAFVIQPMRWWPRYTIWVWGAGAVALAMTADAWLSAGRERRVTRALSVVTVLALVEGGVALFHANGFATALAGSNGGQRFSTDARVAPNAVSWVDGAFFTDELLAATDVCRGAWKPGTDDASLDGVLAQLSPRPRVHVVSDDDGDWSNVHKAWKDAGCTELLLFRGSPVLPLAQQDPEVTVEPAVAFDPLYVVRPRRFSRLAVRNVTP